jgi:Ca2+-binding EF-hand superfamily protein
MTLLKYFFLFSDGDGRISWEELGYVMKTLGHRVSEAHLKEIMKLIDENGYSQCSIIFLYYNFD